MQGYNVKVNGKSYYVEIEEATAPQAVQSAPAPALTPQPQPQPQQAPVTAPQNGTKVIAPLPGLVLRLLANNGATVKKGDKILVLEAMKMEHDITAKADGTIQYLVKQGDSVAAESDLAVIS